PLTFIAGVYGMNFNTETSPWNMPELNWYWGYPACWAVMIAIAAGLVFFFWRRGWFENFSTIKDDSATDVISSTPMTRMQSWQQERK
ncbi:MAG TPA: CorA family divalent cation transporter, partial [Phormidium sp.]